MKKSTKNIVKVIISIIYIVWGIFSPLTAIKEIIELDIGGLASATVGVLMLLAGVFGLMGIKKNKCRIFGVIIFVCAIVAVVLELPAINITSIITAVLAWLFIVCIR